jgi:hypothetical protein
VSVKMNADPFEIVEGKPGVISKSMLEKTKAE